MKQKSEEITCRIGEHVSHSLSNRMLISKIFKGSKTNHVHLVNTLTFMLKHRDIHYTHIITYSHPGTNYTNTDTHFQRHRNSLSNTCTITFIYSQIYTHLQYTQTCSHTLIDTTFMYTVVSCIYTQTFLHWDMFTLTRHWCVNMHIYHHIHNFHIHIHQTHIGTL